MTNPRFAKQGASLISFLLCYQNSSADDQRMFCQILHFVSLVAMWNAAIQRFEYSIVTEILKYETILR